MNEETKTIEPSVEHEILEHVVITSTTTSSRLLSHGKVGVDAFTLYNFYAYTASIQQTSQIFCTEKYCMTGLGWGLLRYRHAKALLVKEQIVESVVRKNGKGQVVHHFVKIHYLINPDVTKTTRVDYRTDGFQYPLNALDKKRNALDKKEKKESIKEKVENYFLEVPEKDVEELSLKFNVSHTAVKNTAEKIHDYILSTGRKYIDPKATLRGWLRRDLEKTNPRKEIPVFADIYGDNPPDA